MSNRDQRVMFDRYVYDYMRKNNMHQTADIFKEEAHVLLDLSIPHAIDVPDGFLHEWWLTFYEMYRLQQPRDDVPGEGLNTMVEQMMVTRQQTDPSPPQYAMNQQAISRVLADDDSWFNTGYNGMGSRRSPLIVAERVPQVIAASSHQHNLLASKSVQYLPGHPANLPVQEVDCSVPAASTKEKDIASEESDGKSINTTDTINGNCSGSCDMDTTSDASLKCKSNDHNVKSSSPHATIHEDNADSSSSKLPECATSADDLKDCQRTPNQGC